MEKNVCLTERRQQDTFLYNLAFSTRSCITHINLENYPWSDKMLLLLMRKTPSMTSVVLDNGTNVTSVSMKNISMYWPDIASISVTGSPMCQEAYQDIGEKCTKLTRLKCSSCPGLVPSTFVDYFGSSKINTLVLDTWVHPGQQVGNKAVGMGFDFSNLQYLTHLQIHNDPLIGRLPDVSSMNDWQSQLVSLSLDECFSMDDSHVVELLRSSPGLQSLTLKDAQFNNSTLSAIATFQPLLQRLNISRNNRVTHRGVRDVARRCPNLSVFVLTHCGIKMIDFPEASPHCSGRMNRNGKMDPLSFLDEQALAIIRSIQ